MYLIVTYLEQPVKLGRSGRGDGEVMAMAVKLLVRVVSRENSEPGAPGDLAWHEAEPLELLSCIVAWRTLAADTCCCYCEYTSNLLCLKTALPLSKSAVPGWAEPLIDDSSRLLQQFRPSKV